MAESVSKNSSVGIGANNVCPGAVCAALVYRASQSSRRSSAEERTEEDKTNSLLFSCCYSPSYVALVLVFVVYNRRHESHIKYPGPDDDVRENIINYDDEGGGEDDMTAFDITPLQIPIGSTIPETVQCKMPIMCK